MRAISTTWPRTFSRFSSATIAASRRLHVDSGWVPAGTRVDELEAAVRAVCEPIFNKPLKDISFGVVLLRLFQTARQFHMEVQPQLVLLQKTLLAIEGLGRQLYPELDLWKTAKPVLEEWMRQRRDPRTRIKELVASWPEISEDLRLLPKLMHRAIRRMEAEDAARARPRLRAPPVPRASARLERVLIGRGAADRRVAMGRAGRATVGRLVGGGARPARDRDEAGRAVRLSPRAARRPCCARHRRGAESDIRAGTRSIRPAGDGTAPSRGRRLARLRA